MTQDNQPVRQTWKKIKFKNSLITAALFSTLSLLQGCIPLVIAATAGMTYLTADEEARENFSAWIEEKQNKVFKKVANEEDSKQMIGYQEGSGLALDINSFSITPSTVKRGESITVMVQYVVVGANSKGVDLTEEQDLWFGNSKIAQLDSQKVLRQNGTWERSSLFKVPDSAEKGKHKIKQSILSDGSKLQISGFFTVIE